MDPTPQKIALALDRLFQRFEELPAESRESLLKELDRINPHLRDQAQANNSLILTRLSQAGLNRGENQPPEWVRLSALEAMAGWMLPNSRTCMHAPHPDRPQPVFACAWRRGLVVCSGCTHLLKTKDPESDATCDGCGHRCAGVEAGDAIYPLVAVVGPLTYLVGLCGSCQASAQAS